MSVRPGLHYVKPSLYIYEFDPSWNLVQEQHHAIDGLNYAHDFLLLPDYYIFHMTPFVGGTQSELLKVYLGWTSPGQQMGYHPSKPSRFVVIPRHSQALHQEVMMLDTAPFHVSPTPNITC